MTIGGIVSEYDYYKTQPMDGYPSRTDYWESYMIQEQLQYKKDKLILLDSDGSNPYIYSFTGRYNVFDEPTFICSDSCRPVFFIIQNNIKDKIIKAEATIANWKTLIY